jgi:hypothetical protein
LLNLNYPRKGGNSDVVNKIALLERARTSGANVVLADVNAVLETKDIVARTQAKKARYRVEIWDKESPVNGVPAERILASRTDIPPGGEVYLIYTDNKLTHFQPHPPDEGGLRPMTRDEALSIANAHVERLAQAEAEAEIAEEVLEELLLL